MNEALLAEHVRRLCQKNLRSNRVKCCARCPFEDEIVAHRPDLAPLFGAKRADRWGCGPGPGPTSG